MTQGKDILFDDRQGLSSVMKRAHSLWPAAAGDSPVAALRGQQEGPASALRRLEAQGLLVGGGGLGSAAAGARPAARIAARGHCRLLCKRHSSQTSNCRRDAPVQRRCQFADRPPQAGEHNGGDDEIREDAVERHDSALAMRKVMNDAP